MAGTAKKTDPELWEKTKEKVTKGDKGGKPGQWSARKAQLAVGEYKKKGGGYAGKKSDDNHLKQWTDEKWGTKSGKESGKTGERYLPKKAREELSDKDYARSTAKKRADTKKGEQFSKQPGDVARKTAKHRDTGAGTKKSTAKKSTATSTDAKTKAGKSQGGKAGAAASRKGRQGAGKGDLASLSRAELVDRARDRGVTGFSRMRKAELVAALKD